VLLDRRDLDILRLAGKYRWLPYDILGKFGFDDLVCEIEKLALNRLVYISKNRYINLTPKGYALLQSVGYNYSPGVKRAYAGSPTLRRRLEAAEIMLTALRAGINVYQDGTDSLRNQPMFLPAFSIQDETKFMSTANFAGFGHWGNKAYMLQYVGSESVGMYMSSEQMYFKNLESAFDNTLKTPSALIFAGSSYEQVYEQICDTTPSNRHGVKGFYDFWDVWQKTDMPIHLLSCDEIGAMQLAFMKEPDLNARIAKIAYGEKLEYDTEIPESDGKVCGDATLIIAADMNMRRVFSAIESSRKMGRKEVMVVAYKEQLQSLLLHILPFNGLVKPLFIEPMIDKVFSKELPLYPLDKNSAATGRIKGDVIHV